MAYRPTDFSNTKEYFFPLSPYALAVFSKEESIKDKTIVPLTEEYRWKFFYYNLLLQADGDLSIKDVEIYSNKREVLEKYIE